jgi:hypothetical protein
MRKIITTTIFILAISLTATPAQQPKPEAPIRLPEQSAAQLKEVLARQAELERQYRELGLLKANLILDAALELGLTKKQLEGLQLSVDAQGQLVLIPKVQPLPSAPAVPEQKK